MSLKNNCIYLTQIWRLVSLWVNKWLETCKCCSFHWRIGRVLWNGRRKRGRFSDHKGLSRNRPMYRGKFEYKIRTHTWHFRNAILLLCPLSPAFPQRLLTQPLAWQVVQLWAAYTPLAPVTCRQPCCALSYNDQQPYQKHLVHPRCLQIRWWLVKGFVSLPWACVHGSRVLQTSALPWASSHGRWFFKK